MARVTASMRAAADGGRGFELVIDMPAVGFESQHDAIAGQIPVDLLGIGLGNPQCRVAQDARRARACRCACYGPVPGPIWKSI